MPGDLVVLTQRQAPSLLEILCRSGEQREGIEIRTRFTSGILFNDLGAPLVLG
jgi:hypothetical protein